MELLLLFKFHVRVSFLFCRCWSWQFLCIKLYLDLKAVLFKGKLLETQVRFIEGPFILYKTGHRSVKIDVGLKAVGF